MLEKDKERKRETTERERQLMNQFVTRLRQ